MIRSASRARCCIAVRKTLVEVRALLFPCTYPAAHRSSSTNRNHPEETSASARSAPFPVSFAQSRICRNASFPSMPFSNRLVRHLMQLRAAQKIRPALHHRHFQVSARNVFAEKEYLFGRAVPAAISSPWKSPRAARCKSPAVGMPASSRSPCPLPRWRGGAVFKRVVHQLRHLQFVPAVTRSRM